MSMHVEYPHKSSPIGPVLYSVSYDKADTYCMRRFKEFETLDMTLKQTDAALPPLPEKHLFFPSPETLSARATALEKYLIALLETGSPDIVQAVASFANIEYSVLAAEYVAADAPEPEPFELPTPDYSPTGIFYMLLGAWWVLVVTAYLLAQHALAAAMALLRKKIAATHPDLLPERIAPYIKTTLIKHTTAQIAKVPPSVKRIASVSADVATRKASLSDGLNVCRDTLAAPAAQLYLTVDGASLTERLPATSRVVPFVETHWPQLVEEVRARTSSIASQIPPELTEAEEAAFGMPTALKAGYTLPSDDRTSMTTDSMSASTFSLSTLPDSQFAPATAAPKAPSSKA